MLYALMVFFQETTSSGGWPPGWLVSGPLPVILSIVAGIFLLGLWINYRLNTIQRRLHALGKDYYRLEQQLLEDLKAGTISESEYRKRHERLIGEMRDEARRITDGPPREGL